MHQEEVSFKPILEVWIEFQKAEDGEEGERTKIEWEAQR